MERSHPATLRGHGAAVETIVFSPDGKRLISGGFDKTIRVWNVNNFQEELRITNSDSVVALAISSDGQAIACGGVGVKDPTIKIYNFVTGKMLGKWPGHSDLITGLAYSRDGKVLVSTGLDGMIVIFDATTGRIIASVKDREAIRSAALTPDGKILVTGHEKRVKLWDTATCRLLRTFDRHKDLVLCICFSPDGKTIASGSGAPFDGNKDTSIRISPFAADLEK